MSLTLLPSRNNPGAAAGAVFDGLAVNYDEVFTESLIGRAQRNAVWKVLLKTFHPKDHLLELNCGTGEDAFFLASRGISVVACDASRKMIDRAEQRHSHMLTPSHITFHHLASEQLNELKPARAFDGAFSNFSGLNCVQDLARIASHLSTLVKTGGHVALCLSTRICLTEIIFYLIQGNNHKAFRRCRGQSDVLIDGIPLTIFYPTIREIRRAFAPHFRLRSRIGIGVAIPPSYMEGLIRHHRTLFKLLCRLETVLAPIPLLRTTGDHVLLCFEKVAS